MISTQKTGTSSTDTASEEQQKKNQNQKTTAQQVDLEKASLSLVTAKVPAVPDAGALAGQVEIQGRAVADSDIAHAATVMSVRPSVSLAAREELYSRVREQAAGVERKIQEIKEQKERPAQVAQESQRREEEKARVQEEQARRLFLWR